MNIATLYRQGLKLNPAKQGSKLNPFSALLHPFDSFYAVKEEGKGSLLAVATIVLVFFLSSIFERQNTGYAFNMNNLDELNVWLVAAKTIALYALWVLSNWVVATWMDGEGKASHIMIVSAYAIMPYVISLIVTTLLSKIMLVEEGVFLHYITVLAILWSSVLMLIGLLIVHDYGFVRNLQSIALTIAAMGIIVFLMILFYTLYQQAYVFVTTIYNEVLFRL
ncbi:YIP1 family protein [Paenibacillus alginolyticus]|uniref:Yip1 family protein n=1 Tax=Paenibacillus alginolyticus TaxID=59839 RepID=UPI0004232912|nr:Yip1 family protein [Paenibacillus alginolyticus]MCY9663544.1 YIP1 family protein [Paenibacillus alginolyticus]